MIPMMTLVGRLTGVNFLQLGQTDGLGQDDSTDFEERKHHERDGHLLSFTTNLRSSLVYVEVGMMKGRGRRG
jgi:hypothetical protein